MKRIYLDYASLTPIDKGVLKQMAKYSTGEYSNPSSLYASGIAAKRAVNEAKERISKVIHAHPDEIIFTSGGTESNDLVLRKFVGKKIMVSAIEHSSITNSSSLNSDINKNVIRIPVDQNGIVDLEFLKNNLNKEIGLVSVMLVNNEIGAIEPIHEVVKIVRDFNKDNGTSIKVHTDACQAAIHLPLYVEKLGVDMMTLDGGKIYGPRGVGMLYVKRSVNEDVGKIEREGTENVPGIMTFAYALELAEKMREDETIRVAELKSFFFSELKKINPNIKVNGSVNGLLENAVPGILNISIPNIDNEFFLLQLDAKGIEVSTKSACLRDEDESYVLKEIGASSKNSVRFSFGRRTTKGEVKGVLKVIGDILGR
jgi:cysteine desulfurase